MATVITLLTDFAHHDPYVGVMKGVISSINSEATVIDLCHGVPAHDIREAAYDLWSAYKFFPEGTIHICVVDPGVGTKRPIVAVETDKYTFLAPDNGLLSWTLRNEKIKGIVEVTNSEYFLPAVSRTFHGRDIMAPVAAHLSKGTELSSLGKWMGHVHQLDLPRAIISDDGRIKGSVIHIDRFGNVISNISARTVADARRRGQYRDITVKIAGASILGLVESYQQVDVDEFLAILGSTNLMEISLNKGNAAEELGAALGAEVLVFPQRKDEVGSE